MGTAKIAKKRKSELITNKKAKKLEAMLLKSYKKSGITKKPKGKKLIKQEGKLTPNKNVSKVSPQQEKKRKERQKKDGSNKKQKSKKTAQTDNKSLPESSPIDDEEKKNLKAEKAKRTIFVGNLELNTKKKQVNSYFSSCGEIESVRLRTCDGEKVTKTNSKKVNGSLNAYVVFRSENSVKEALKLTGTEFKGRHIRVDSTTKTEKDKENTSDNKRIIFVGNLRYSATDEKLFNLFSSCGEVEYARTIQCKQGCKGVAFVCFRKPESVGLALELNNTLLDDRPIHVEHYSNKKLKGSTKATPDRKQISTVNSKKTNNSNLKKPLKKKEKVKGKNSSKAKEDEETKLSKKKSEFRGVQVTSKKKFKLKKTKGNSMLKLAKKIAPRQ